MEKASTESEINFSNFRKYIKADGVDAGSVEKAILVFANDPEYENRKFDVKDIEIGEIANTRNVVILLPKAISFSDFKNLLFCIHMQADNKQVNGILLDQISRINSFFLFVDLNYLPGETLVGKTYTGRKLYSKLNDEGESRMDFIYFNSNIEYFRKIRFDRFEETVSTVRFRKLKDSHDNQQP